MSFDFIIGAKEILDQEGYPYVFVQVKAGPGRNASRRSWNLGLPPEAAENSKILAVALRKFANELEGLS